MATITASPRPRAGAQRSVDGARPATRRLTSIDALRGFVLAFMLWTPPIVDPDAYPLLVHAHWYGWTLSDLVLPTFLFTSGLSLAFLLKPPGGRDLRLRLVRRTAGLIVLGVLYNLYGTEGGDLSEVRLTGVLQLIGVSGALAALTVLLTRSRRTGDRPRVIALVAVALPVLYGAGLALLSERCPVEVGCSPYHGLDRALFAPAHTYHAGAVGYDPEGLAVVVVATAIVLAGYLAGYWVRLRRPPSGLAAAAPLLVGIVAIGGAALLATVVPFSKRLHTPSFSLLAVGAGLSLFGLFALTLDVRARWRPIDRLRGVSAHPFVVLGRNALVVFLGERILLVSLAGTHVDTPAGPVSAHDWLIANVVPLEGPAAALGYSTMLLLILLAVTYTMHALRWRIAL